MRPDWPGPDVFGSTFFVPIAPPTANATTTRASHPKVAVFQWPALQRPTRAARLEWGRAFNMLSLRRLTTPPTLRPRRSKVGGAKSHSASHRATIRPTTQVGGGAAP